MTKEPRSEDESGTELIRGIALIILTGLALGVGFNALQRAAGSERALAWIGKEVELASLEDLNGGAESVVMATPQAAAETDSAPPPAEEPPPEPPPAPAANTTAPPPATDTETARTEPAPPPTPADLPVIPDSQDPIAIQYADVKKFHEANAAVFVDARSRGEYEEGHIPGAAHLSADAAFEDPDAAEAIDPQGKPIITYCSSADCNLSRDLAYALIEAGHRKVLVYVEGVAGWRAEGESLVTGAEAR